jgi:hypothetical protein
MPFFLKQRISLQEAIRNGQVETLINIAESIGATPEYKKHGWNKDGADSKAKGAENSRKKYEELNKQIKLYETSEDELKNKSKEAWNEIGAGIS